MRKGKKMVREVCDVCERRMVCRWVRVYVDRGCHDETPWVRLLLCRRCYGEKEELGQLMDE